MSQNGEKELILGNKQLISLFFIVVALCGVFFAMGYMVRGNAVKGSISTTDDSAANQAATIKRQQPEPPRETAAETAPPETTAPSDTHPAEDTSAPPVDEPKPVQKADAIKPEGPEVGASYVQVVALGRSDAEATVRTLREQHLPALLAASSKEGLYRVLVGPYQQTADVADAKARLKTLGFSNTIVQKQ